MNFVAKKGDKPMYTMTTLELYQLLQQHQLLAQAVDLTNVANQTFTHLSYDSRDIQPNTLFFCKGLNFKKELLLDALAKGVTTYLTEVAYETAAQEILVTDIREAMAVVAQAFYQHPQEKLTKIGITGTKGKTTTAYLLHQLLKDAFGPKIALFSSEETTIDGKNYAPSKLTTPEALVLYQQMAQAVENGLTHLVMEVSSQAYKTKRVFGLTFEVGIFLNISPDHISPIEHEDFADYFFCKQQLLLHSKQMIINQQSDHFDSLQRLCQENQIPFLTYGDLHADYPIIPQSEPRQFALNSSKDPLNLNDTYTLAMFGSFNHGNATAALMTATFLHAPSTNYKESLVYCTIPGRMNMLELPNGTLVFVDFAHNYLSLKSMGTMAKEIRPNARALLLTGSAGGKAISRRKDMGQAISEVYDLVVLTRDDPNFEDPAAIAAEIQSHITNPDVKVYHEMARDKAIALVLSLAKPEDIVILAGKGTEPTMKEAGQDVPYQGDLYFAKQWIDQQVKN